MKKYAIIADIHSNLYAFNKILDECAKEQITEFIFLGDYVLDGFDSNKVVDLVREKGMCVIRGNKEDFIVDIFHNRNMDIKNYSQFHNIFYSYERLSEKNIRYIDKLPDHKIINLDSLKICVSHGIPNNTRKEVFKDSYELFDRLITSYSCDVYIFAHTHRSFFITYKNKFFINPGSAGIPTDTKNYEYGILSIDDDINYQQKSITIDFNDIKHYYESSDYHIENKVWHQLLMMGLKDGKGYDYIFDYFKYLKQCMTELGLEFTGYFPNHIYDGCFEDYLNSRQNRK